jgi:uncharacterized protein YqgC (DUF456 family)
MAKLQSRQKQQGCEVAQARQGAALAATGGIPVQIVLYKALLVLFYIYLFVALALNIVGLPGNWILVATAAVVALVPHFGDLTWTYFFVILGLALLGEAIESLLGLVVVAKKGGTRWGVFGSFLGGIGGVVVGSAVAPPFGGVVLGFVGAFAGAVAGEYIREQRGDQAVRVGFWAFVGRSLAIMGKIACGLGIVWILILRTWI